MVRDYIHLERYLNELIPDIYEQPSDEGHQEQIEDVVSRWVANLQGLSSVLDAGCGQGQAIPELQRYAKRVAGVTLGSDAEICQEKGYEVYRADMSFLPFNDGEFDLVFARHSLEHSPMPLLTLMEWHRVAKQWLLLITPDLAHFGPGGRNHYYVLQTDQWDCLLRRAGWYSIWHECIPYFEYRWVCEKGKRL